MAVTAKFQADFSSFLQAIDKAEVALVDFGQGAGKVESSLNRMVDNFSGRKLIQEASLMTIAVEKAGGIATLTASEIEKVGTKANEAADKMKKLGYDVPAGLQKLADETKNVDTASGALTDTVKTLAAGFLAMFTARAAFSFVKDTINEASALKDLSQQTHINVEELQLLAGGMSEFGVDADTLGKGLYKLSRGIAGGDESVASGLHLMGMSLKDVEGLNGKDLFLKIEGGLATLQGGLRDTAAADLFGGRLGAAMAGASEGINGALENWQHLNHVASTESVDAMDTFGESIARANKNLSSIAANMIGPIAQGFNVLNDAADKGASKWSIAWAMMKDFAASSTATGASTANLAQLLDDLNQKTEANTKRTADATAGHGAAVVALDAHGQAAKFMAALELDAATPLLGWQLQYLDHLKEIGSLDAKHAAGIGVTTEQFKQYTESMAEAKKAAEALTAETKAYDAVVTHMHMETFKLAQEHEKQWRAESLAGAARVNVAIMAELDAQVKLNAEYGRTVDGQLKMTGAGETLRVALEALKLTKVEGISQEKEEQVLLDAYTKALYGEAVAQDVLAAATARTTASYYAQIDAMARAAGMAATGNRPGEGNSGVNQGSMERGPGVNQAVTVPINNWTGPYAPPGRAEGGSVSGGLPYMVGERGPELFVPKSAGSIIPHGRDGATINVYVTQPLGTPQAIAAAVDDAVVKSLRSRGVKLGSG